MQVKFLPTIVSLVFRKLGFPWVVLLATGTLAVTFEGLSNLVKYRRQHNLYQGTRLAFLMIMKFPFT